MRSRQWYLVAALGVAAAVAISGSVGLMEHADRDDSFTETRDRFDRALAALNVRIEGIRDMPAHATDSIASLILPSNLAERSAQISASLDSLESENDLERMGAIAGLRANLAELEYRVDLAEIACARDVAATDSLVEAWLQEDSVRLAAAERTLADSAAGAAFDDALREARGEHERLGARYAGLRERDSGIDALHALARDLAGVRRHHRAIVRSIAYSS
jgi:hypothetical protein